MVSVALAITLGLLASFVQSLGLTIQRKSHLIAARQPIESRPPEWRQPIWVLGFLIFIVANIGGTVFQIGALPIVMLAPLGAVSLLYNALLAKFLLHDALGATMIVGTALILVGAVLIGYFGAIQEPPHSLDELLALFGRPPFIGLATILFMALLCVLSLAHLADWQLAVQLQRGVDTTKRHATKPHTHHRLSRRWSAPMLAPLDEVSETTSGVATPVLEGRDREAQQQRVGPRDYGSISSRLEGAKMAKRRPPSIASSCNHEPDQAAITRTRLALAVAFAAVSGTLSGLCLLLAKSGVELLVLTFALGRNQFNRLGSWALVFIMLIAALAQLWYLNKALKMADPTLVCPLAFCFYNTSSIALGLVYFDQLDDIPATSLLLVILGIGVLLTGVFIVSTKPQAAAEGGIGSGDVEQGAAALNGGATSESPLAMASSPTETEALLANVGGIGGPHLPPPSPSPQQQQASPKRRHRRTSSSSSRASSSSSGTSSTTPPVMAGLGLHLPSYYLERDDDDDDAPSSAMPGAAQSNSPSKSRRSSASAAVTANDSPGPSSSPSPSASPSTHTHTRRASHPSSTTLYSTILNRGLSIGIGPSSPGFHISPFSPTPEDEEASRDEVQRRDRNRTRTTGAGRHHSNKRPKRTFSEADVPVSAAHVEDDGESTAGDDRATRSSWFKAPRQWWRVNVTRVGDDEENRRRERRTLGVAH